MPPKPIPSRLTISNSRPSVNFVTLLKVFTQITQNVYFITNHTTGGGEIKFDVIPRNKDIHLLSLIG